MKSIAKIFANYFNIHVVTIKLTVLEFCIYNSLIVNRHTTSCTCNYAKDPIKTQFVYICHKNVHETLTILVQHYHLFPKSLGDVLTTYKVKELHLSQTQGLWKHEKWGYPPEDAPPGDELWVWFQPHSG